MATRKTCDKCEHYMKDDMYQNKGSCSQMGDANDLSFDAVSKMMGDKTTDCKAYGWDYESYRAGVYVGPKFGCIHWVKASA